VFPVAFDGLIDADVEFGGASQRVDFSKWAAHWDFYYALSIDAGGNSSPRRSHRNADVTITVHTTDPNETYVLSFQKVQRRFYFVRVLDSIQLRQQAGRRASAAEDTRSVNTTYGGKAMIEVRGLYKAYGLNLAVRGVSFQANKGEIVGLVGRNGAGKIHPMNIIAPDTSPRTRGTSGSTGTTSSRNRSKQSATSATCRSFRRSTRR
jgi:ABC-type glutathione transport system ATPase component